jgi:catechol 2,3-dioxygenase-like lactoylglutathione lyase family enzyme
MKRLFGRARGRGRRRVTRVIMRQASSHEPGPGAKKRFGLSEGGGTIGSMTVNGRLELVALDAADIDVLASFYAELTGWDIVRKESDWITVRAEDGQEIAFQLAPDHVPPRWPGQELPQHFHLDLLVDDHESAAARAVALGATRLADGPTWITLADPAGHPFDLCQKEGVGPGMGLFAVTIDAPDAAMLARFYAELMGMELTYEGAEGALISADGKSVMFQQVEDYNPPRWPDPAHPQQAHLDVLVDDLDAGESFALQLGATRLDAGAEGFRVFADPAAHPFCLTTA